MYINFFYLSWSIKKLKNHILIIVNNKTNKIYLHISILVSISIAITII